MIEVFNDEYFMNHALLEARLAAQEDEVPVGAIVVCGDKIISKAHNQTECLNDPTAHAEMLAITAAANSLGAKYLKNCRLYVTVEPCVMCAGAIAWSQIETVIFGANDEKKGYLRYAPDVLNGKTKIRSGVMKDECSQEIKTFFSNKR
jgi:tRNA(adenine34) deaminase